MCSVRAYDASTMHLQHLSHKNARKKQFLNTVQRNTSHPPSASQPPGLCCRHHESTLASLLPQVFMKYATKSLKQALLKAAFTDKHLYACNALHHTSTNSDTSSSCLLGDAFHIVSTMQISQLATKAPVSSGEKGLTTSQHTRI